MKCHVDEACLGGQNSTCEVGYSGRRCGACADGYYKLSRVCKQCGSKAETLTLVVVLALAGVLVVAFLQWQTLRDPRVGSPIVFLMRILETLSIFSLAVARWPLTVSTFLSVISLVNFNTQMFQTECLLGRPHPTRAALMYVCSIAVVLLVLLLLFPLWQLWKRHKALQSASLESMCEPLRPSKDSEPTHAPLSFTPSQALCAATFPEYVMISITVIATRL